MTNNPNPTPTRRMRRNNIIKNIFMVLMAIVLIVLAIFVLKGCNKDTTSDTDNLGVIPTIGCTCTEADKCQCVTNNGTADNSALLVEIDLLKAELEALKAENETLKSGATADDKALADAKADAASWKSKYDTLYKTHSSCTSVDLSKYVSVNDYNKLVNEYNTLVGKYNDLDKAHQSCTSVDLSKYVLKSTYDELVTNYNKVVAEFATFKQNHTNCNGLTYVEADHSNCVAKSTYQAVLNELAGWRNHVCPTANHNSCVSQSEYKALNAKYQTALNEIAQLKAHKCPTANHNNCVSASDYNSLNAKYSIALRRISDLEDEIAELKAHKCPTADHASCNRKIASLEAEICELKAELAQLQSHKCDHSNCGTGTTIIQADHSNCVSLRDYNELLAAYNALLND